MDKDSAAGHNFDRLKAHILPLSKSSNFDDAKREWTLVAIEKSEQTDNCPCGQKIREHCYIRNTETNAHTYVGNVCIRRFMGINVQTLFDGLERIRGPEAARANHDLIEYAKERGYLYDEREYQFLLSIRKKQTRTLTEKQLNWERKAQRRILEQLVVSTRTSR